MCDRPLRKQVEEARAFGLELSAHLLQRALLVLTNPLATDAETLRAFLKRQATAGLVRFTSFRFLVGLAGLGGLIHAGAGIIASTAAIADSELSAWPCAMTFRGGSTTRPQ